MLGSLGQLTNQFCKDGVNLGVFVMIGFLLYVFSLFFVQGFANLLLDHNVDEREDIMWKFGSVQSGMLTLIEHVTNGQNPR